MFAGATITKKKKTFICLIEQFEQKIGILKSVRVNEYGNF